MTLGWTLALLAVGLALTGLARWHETRPREIGEVRLFPTTAVLAAGVLLSVLASAHLVSLIIGMPLRGRYSP
ncbi:MAG: hypothetical protein ACJ8H8_04920 [Geminicoccaceae bacterium]